MFTVTPKEFEDLHKQIENAEVEALYTELITQTNVRLEEAKRRCEAGTRIKDIKIPLPLRREHERHAYALTKRLKEDLQKAGFVAQVDQAPVFDEHDERTGETEISGVTVTLR